MSSRTTKTRFDKVIAKYTSTLEGNSLATSLEHKLNGNGALMKSNSLAESLEEKLNG
jgi:hypothetical protein